MAESGEIPDEFKQPAPHPKWKPFIFDEHTETYYRNPTPGKDNKWIKWYEQDRQYLYLPKNQQKHYEKDYQYYQASAKTDNPEQPIPGNSKDESISVNTPKSKDSIPVTSESTEPTEPTPSNNSEEPTKESFTKLRDSKEASSELEGPEESDGAEESNNEGAPPQETPPKPEEGKDINQDIQIKLERFTERIAEAERVKEEGKLNIERIRSLTILNKEMSFTSKIGLEKV